MTDFRIKISDFRFRKIGALLKAVAGIVVLVALLLCSSISGCNNRSAAAKHRVMILGIDGMDYEILKRLMDAGKMPNFSKLAQKGDFKPLLSSIPPQSPVAWANFITGKNPGGHGIFDFIHRKPNEILLPYLSTTETKDPKWNIPLGKYQIPLISGEVELLRRGEAFWQMLDKRGIPSVIYRIPSNFPPVECGICKELSGMGTPDILGTYGTFSYFTDNPPDNSSSITGGKVYTVWVENNHINAELIGPPNTFIKGAPEGAAPFDVYVDPEKDAALIEINDQKILLEVGGWSDWVTVEFDLIPVAPGVTGIVKFYLKQVRPDFKLYVTPINIDPSNPALPISVPKNYSKDLSDDLGKFYTQGMAEDTKARQHEILNDDEYVTQALMVLEQSEAALWHEFDQWKEGVFFHYFSSLDLNQHMLWRAFDTGSPTYSEEVNKKYGNFVENLYIEMDKVLGRLMSKLDDDTTLIVMSDHGFAPYYRQFNINTWLLDNGYIALNDSSARSQVEFLQGVDWSRSKVYNIGINGVYLNLRGREANGIVEPGGEEDALLAELVQKLEAVVDEKTGKKAIRRVFLAKKVYSGPYAKDAPDLIIGFDRGYRNSDDSALGEFPDNWFDDNMNSWSGDHCMDPAVVPGIILSNRKIANPEPYLYDVAATVLKEYGISPPADMIGRPIW